MTVVTDATDAEVVRLIEPDGTPVASSGRLDGALEELLGPMCETMIGVRLLDEELVNLQRQGQLALYPSCRGQEAAQVGCTWALRATDWIFPQYRELGMFVVRGVDPGGVGLAWRGAWHGGFGFIERSVAPISIPIGTQALHAVGAAMASGWLGDGGVTVACIGDGATSEGDVHEALNLAAVRAAPCLFYVQNNGWAISMPRAEQCRAATLADKAIGYGMPGVRVDGNDVAACYVVVAEAAARARAGGGPTFIEAVTYRLGAHTTSDDPKRYRSDDEVAAWDALDPIERVRRYLQGRGAWSDEHEARARERAMAMRSRLRDAVQDAPDPSPLELFDHVFSTPSPALIAQRAALAEELDAGA